MGQTTMGQSRKKHTPEFRAEAAKEFCDVHTGFDA
jgi:hypothetical protein